VLVARTLRQLEASTHSEVAAARVAWPALAHGLPPAPSPATRLAVAAAERRAGELTLPGYVTNEAGGLTGPAVGVGGLLKAYAALTPRGWRFLAAALATEPTAAAQGGRSSRAAGGPARTVAAARFLRANAGLYLYCVYDGHYDLSLVGKALQGAYHKLGGPPAFGRPESAPSQSQRAAQLVRRHSLDPHDLLA
jgi:hypothetical protein